MGRPWRRSTFALRIEQSKLLGAACTGAVRHDAVSRRQALAAAVAKAMGRARRMDVAAAPSTTPSGNRTHPIAGR